MPLSALVTTSLFSISVSLFLFCLTHLVVLLGWPKVHLGLSTRVYGKIRTNILANPIFFRFHVEVVTYSICHQQYFYIDYII